MKSTRDYNMIFYKENLLHDQFKILIINNFLKLNYKLLNFKPKDIRQMK